ncbi:secreted protein [Streptomyces sviceus ATCC 29083]|uniref:Secreted protein n=2 Tax=Streptomyces TaxID=1883 RepID=B5HZQ7_STRX2|nr:secreted protein [Streptomyces sviceus ATCC 29083]
MMSIRFTARARRGIVALTVAAGLAVGVAGCGGGGGDDKKPEASASASRGDGSQPSTQEGQSDVPLAELKGQDGLLLQITSAQRDAGGFVTVNGNLKNDSDKSVVVPAAVRGDETEIVRNGRSLGGATLVDSKGKKRYYVLRDTDGRPLTTTGFSSLKAGESLAVFMQFPAPPEGTTEVAFQLPTFASAPIQISG